MNTEAAKSVEATVKVVKAVYGGIILIVLIIIG